MLKIQMPLVCHNRHHCGNQTLSIWRAKRPGFCSIPGVLWLMVFQGISNRGEHTKKPVTALGLWSARCFNDSISHLAQLGPSQKVNKSFGGDLISQLRKTLPASKDVMSLTPSEAEISPSFREVMEGEELWSLSFCCFWSCSAFCAALCYSQGGGDVISKCLTNNFCHIHKWITQQYLTTENKKKTQKPVAVLFITLVMSSFSKQFERFWQKYQVENSGFNSFTKMLFVHDNNLISHTQAL